MENPELFRHSQPVELKALRAKYPFAVNTVERFIEEDPAGDAAPSVSPLKAFGFPLGLVEHAAQ